MVNNLYLLTYLPLLNPIEKLWAFIKIDVFCLENNNYDIMTNISKKISIRLKRRHLKFFLKLKKVYSLNYGLLRYLVMYKYIKNHYI
jgi:hypothetical protein